MRYEKTANTNLRYAVLSISFCVICLAFLITLGVIQMIGTDAEYDDATVRTVTVSGLRGEIYDCRGRLIVGNSTDYDLIYEYGAMPETYKEINAELLDVIDTLERTGNSDKLTKNYFPIVGDYPDVSYSEAAQDKESVEYYQLTKVLSRLELDVNTDATEASETAAETEKECVCHSECDVCQVIEALKGKTAALTVEDGKAHICDGKEIYSFAINSSDELRALFEAINIVCHDCKKLYKLFDKKEE